MTEITFQRPSRPLSSAEAIVMNAFRDLPAGFELVSNSKLHSDDGLIAFVPDFIVRSSDGSQLVIEVKSPASLSMINLEKLRRIGRMLNISGKKFLVIVVGSEFDGAYVKQSVASEPLNIQWATKPADILRATLKEFDRRPDALSDS
jgi:hypothetical protein